MSNQVRVKAHRNFVLTSTFGHAIQFRKNEETTIPKVLLAEALSQGVIPVEDEDLPADAPAPDEAPMDLATRQAEIKKAIAKLKAANIREDFGATGNPKVTAVEKVLGWRTSAKEIEPVLQQMNDEAAEARLNK